MSDSEDYDFQYSEEESGDEDANYVVENQYYAAKTLIEQKKYTEAATALAEIIKQDEDSGFQR